jgi:hypothetical protein
VIFLFLIVFSPYVPLIGGGPELPRGADNSPHEHLHPVSVRGPYRRAARPPRRPHGAQTPALLRAVRPQGHGVGGHPRGAQRGRQVHAGLLRQSGHLPAGRTGPHLGGNHVSRESSLAL